MPPEELLQKLQTRPFEPFRIYLTDGTSYDIRHPELVMVGRRAAIVGVTERERRLPLYDRHTKVALVHIVRLEPVAASAT